MFRQNKLLYMHDGNGGAGGVFKGKTTGQDINIQKIIDKFNSGNLEGQIEGTMALKGKPLLLGYVASFHPVQVVRSLAMRDLEDPAALCTVIRSSPHPDLVKKAFEKVRGKLAILGDRDRYLVAMHAPAGEMRREALELMRRNFRIITIPERGLDYDDLVSGVDWGERCQNHGFIASVEMLEAKVLEGGPFTKEQFECRDSKFIPEKLEVLLSKG